MSDINAVAQAIIGKRVIAVRNDKDAFQQDDGGYPGTVDGSTLVLDDGTELTLYASDSDCCATAEGNWVLQPNNLDAAITAVTIHHDEERSGGNGDPDYEETVNYATVTVLHNQNPIALADCSANDGNGGFYYSILSIAVKLPGSDELTPRATVVQA